MELLKYCKSLGTVVVGINSDEGVKRLKGDDRPFFDVWDRKFMLESCKYVDQVYVFDEDTPHQLIKTIKPDIVVKGGDYRKEEVVGNDLAEVKIFNLVSGYSTTKILEKI